MPKKRKACPSSFDKASVKVGRPSKDGCTIKDAVKLVSSSLKRNFWMTMTMTNWVLMMYRYIWRTQNIFCLRDFCSINSFPGLSTQQSVTHSSSASCLSSPRNWYRSKPSLSREEDRTEWRGVSQWKYQQEQQGRNGDWYFNYYRSNDRRTNLSFDRGVVLLILFRFQADKEDIKASYRSSNSGKTRKRRLHSSFCRWF